MHKALGGDHPFDPMTSSDGSSTVTTWILHVAWSCGTSSAVCCRSALRNVWTQRRQLRRLGSSFFELRFAFLINKLPNMSLKHIVTAMLEYPAILDGQLGVETLLFALSACIQSALAQEYCCLLHLRQSGVPLAAQTGSSRSISSLRFRTIGYMFWLSCLSPCLTQA